MSDLIARLGRPEDNFTERKPEGAGAKEFAKAIIAFANTVPEGSEAVLFIGVGDKGQVAGVGNTDQLQMTIRRIAERDCYPPIPVRCEVLQADGKSVLAVHVSSSPTRPHFAGPAYLRKGSESVRAAPDEVEQLIAARTSKARRILEWKDQLVTVVSMGRRLGRTGPRGSAFREELECIIRECDDLTVRVEVIAGSRSAAEPLERIELSHDMARNRLKLIVDGR